MMTMEDEVLEHSISVVITRDKIGKAQSDMLSAIGRIQDARSSIYSAMKLEEPLVDVVYWDKVHDHLKKMEDTLGDYIYKTRDAMDAIKDEDTDHIRPCPFCKSEAFAEYDLLDEMWHVRCKKCGARSGKRYSMYGAILSWNGVEEL